MIAFGIRGWSKFPRRLSAQRAYVLYVCDGLVETLPLS